MTIYLDVIFLENLCMNYIILFATSLISKSERKQIRIIISSILGGTYAIISLLPIFKIYTTIIFKFLISILMVYIAYNPNTIKELFKKVLLFYLTSFAFGGCAFALLYFVKPQEIFMKNGLYIGTYPIKIALLGGLVGFCVIVNAFKLIKNKTNKKDIYCYIKIKFDNKEAEARALIDTGNMLREPISHTPVVIVQKDILKKCLPKEILDNTDKIIENTSEIAFDVIENSRYLNKLKLIPFSSLGMQHGMLLGFKADGIQINYNEEIKESKNIIVGIYEKKLSKNDTYTALIGLDTIMEEETENEYFKFVKN